jgi:predicted DNA-binding mobile mystery protein A
MTQSQLARRLGVTKQNVAKLESDEVRGKTSIATLERVASALECNFLYVIAPKQSIETIISRQALRRATQKLQRVNQSQALEESAVSSTALSIMVKDLADEMMVQRSSDLWDE